MRKRIEGEVLKNYYELWLSGVSSSDIKKKLKMSDSEFNKYTPDFLAYCRHQIAHDVRIRLRDGHLPDLVNLTPERSDEFIGHIAAGLDISQAALYMDVPLVTVMDYWFKDKHFKSKVDHAVKMQNAGAVKALYRRVIGYDYMSETKNITTYKKPGKKKELFFGEEETYEDETELTTVENVTYKPVHVMPDVSAGKFWLINQMPERFSTNPSEKQLEEEASKEQSIIIGGNKIEF